MKLFLSITALVLAIIQVVLAAMAVRASSRAKKTLEEYYRSRGSF